MGLPEAYERHRSGLRLCVGSVALFIAIEVPADVSHGLLRTSAAATRPTRWQTGIPPLQIDSRKCRKTACFERNERRRAPTIRVRLHPHHTADTRCQILCARLASSPHWRFCSIESLRAVTRGTEHEAPVGVGTKARPSLGLPGCQPAGNSLSLVL
jgi:hypothetical protein